MLTLTRNRFNSDPFWSQPIDRVLFRPLAEDFALFDQNGYDLTALEQRYARANDNQYHNHREHRHALKQPWFEPVQSLEGPILNHSNLFERKGYNGRAREQLEIWSEHMPLCQTLLALRPKWGLDFAMDYVDRQGNVLELLHWEWDGFDCAEVIEVKAHMEQRLLAIDWPQAAQYLLRHKDQWHGLDFFGQSAWKCDYFGIPHERFKMVAWA